MSSTSCQKKRSSGRYQLQFPVSWVREKLGGRTAESWRSEILRQWSAASPVMKKSWRYSFVNEKNNLMNSTLAVSGLRKRTGRRFDRSVYRLEAQQIYTKEHVPDDATPKLLARCFQHSVDFISEHLLQRGASSASAIHQDVLEASYCESNMKEFMFEDLDTEEDNVDFGTQGAGDVASEVKFSVESSRLTTNIHPNKSGIAPGQAESFSDWNDDVLIPAPIDENLDHDELFCFDGLLSDTDFMYGARDMNCASEGCPHSASWPGADSEGVGRCSSKALEGFEAELTATLQQRDDALAKCWELQTRVDQLKKEKQRLVSQWEGRTGCYYRGTGIGTGAVYLRCKDCGWLH